MPWPLDPFQEEAIRGLEGARGVLVSAPTSSGKTVIADYCCHRALKDGLGVVYTTPLKALSNQKFRDMTRRYGADRVGLVTGENTINGEAPLVVMTTEILRNILYEDPSRLDLVRWVILDEVHYIDDFPRGSVWEEIVIQAPAGIKFVGLSATIANHAELAAWMSENRGRVVTVVHEERPTKLTLYLAIQNRLLPLFQAEDVIDRHTWERGEEDDERVQQRPGFRLLPENDLLKVLDELAGQQMLPAIYFIFSRRGCREALQRCAYHEIDLTTEADKEVIAQRVDTYLAAMEDRSEAQLFFRLLDRDMLLRGLAVHHAGLLPRHKELVEELFTDGLLKVVFATETLSLGINMPARSVVVSSFTKFDGVSFSTLTTGELTQLMGRAGRRGIDVSGNGVILKEPDVSIATIYEVAMGESLTVVSKFLPTYNMALNLLSIYTPEDAERLMERSFGQFQKRDVEGETAVRVENLKQRVQDLEATWDCDRCRPEDLEAYYRLEDRLRAVRFEARRLRREAVPVPRRGRGQGGYRGQPHGVAGRRLHSLDEERKQLLASQRRLPVVSCPRFAEHLARHSELHRLGAELRAAERRLAESAGEYARRFRRLCRLLADSGFLEGDRPTDKGWLAARIYGENSVLVAEAAWNGWFDALEPAELCACLVALASEDRGGRERPPHPARRGATPAVTQTIRLLRHLYLRFADLEHEVGEPTLRPPAQDYVEFAYRWALGQPMESIALPPGSEVGDAIRVMKGLYSLLRQLDHAVREAGMPLAELASRAVAAMERDVIRRP